MTQNEITGIVGLQSTGYSDESQRSEGEALPFLESITNSPSHAQEKRSAQVMVYFLQSVARELLPDQRVAWCLRRLQHFRETVEIIHDPERQAAYYRGLMRCSRIWMCPVCARKITETRRVELDALIEGAKVSIMNSHANGWIAIPKFHLSMLTFTLAHDWQESAAKVLDRLTRSYARFASGRWYQGFKQTYFIVGTIKALEMTHGENGWHPHYHLLVFHDSYLPPGRQVNDLLQEHPGIGITQADYIASARLHWSEVVFALGGATDLVRGVDLVYGNTHRYAVKLAGDSEMRDWLLVQETMKQPVKHGRNGNRSLTDLLIAYAHGDIEAGDLWCEAVFALNRKKHIEASKGLWTMLGRDVSTDETAAEDVGEETHTVLASLLPDQWRQIIRLDERGQVLDIAARGSADELWTYLESIGINPV